MATGITASPSTSPVPLFSEGQSVVVVADPALPSEMVPLTTDATGTRSGSAVPAGAMLTVLDGELRDNAWVYAVRSRDGMTGWLPERRLRLQR